VATLDALTPALAVLAVAISLSHLASGAAFGKPTGLPWGIELWGLAATRTNLRGAGSRLNLSRALAEAQVLAGETTRVYFLSFIALTALARIFLEGIPGRQPDTGRWLRVAQIVAWIVLAISLWRLRKLASHPLRQAGEYLTRCYLFQLYSSKW